MANKYFLFFDNRIAEGITTTGQYAIQAVSRTANAYMSKICKKEMDYVVYNDTDSCVGSSLVYVNDKQIPIEKLYDMFSDYTKYDPENQNFVKPTVGITTKSFNTEKEQIETKQIKYVMKHKVKKEMFRITSEDGNSVVVTGDHSVIVRRNNAYASIKPKYIVEDDIIITTQLK